jgi:biotin carboxylase
VTEHARQAAKTIVCLASYFKGVEFLREARRQGARVFLITKEKLRDEDWPRDALEALVTVHDQATADHYVHAATEIARRHRLSRVVALEEFDVITAGLVREHLRLPGLTSSEARLFRDKLAMRCAARDAGIRVPPFVHALNYQDVGEYMERVRPPWVMKPRTDVSAIGIRKLDEAEQVWRHIDALDARERPQERSTFHLLEQYVAGEVFHVDSIIAGGEITFAGANRYGRPPMNVAHDGGAFLSHTLEHDSDERRELLEINRRVISALGLREGATHGEFIRGRDDGEFYFLEIAARVGGAFIAETHEAATGVNLWREWARVELADESHPYEPPPARDEHSGIVLSLARQEWPDTAAYGDPEIAFRPRKRHHAALIVRSPSHARVVELLDAYARRFADDFIAVAPPLERPE